MFCVCGDQGEFLQQGSGGDERIGKGYLESAAGVTMDEPSSLVGNG